MHLTRYSSPADFLRRAEPFLLEREVEHTVMLGVVGRLASDPHAYGSGDVYLALVEEGDQVVGASAMTPPYNLQLSYLARPGVIPLIAADVRAFPPPPGVIAPSEDARAFAGHWHALTGQPVRRGLCMRLFRLDAVIPPRPVAGHMRRIEERDRPVIKQWAVGFIKDANLSDPLPDDERLNKMVNRFLGMPPDGAQGLYVWETGGQIVSMTAAVAPTPHGLRVNQVYTPAEHRRKGYASALVAAVSQRVLDSGCTYASLFTDLANPTSNHIYQEIGYRPLMDVDEYKFGQESNGR